MYSFVRSFVLCLLMNTYIHTFVVHICYILQYYLSYCLFVLFHRLTAALNMCNRVQEQNGQLEERIDVLVKKK